MSGYAVEPGDLVHVDASLRAAVAGSRTALAGLRHAADVLLERGWQGAAASSFRPAWERWLAGAQAMLRALAATAAAVGTAGNGYAATEDAVRTAVVRCG